MGDVFVLEAAEAVSVFIVLCTRSSPIPEAPVLHNEPERGVGHARQALMRERRPGIKPAAEEPRDDVGIPRPDQCAIFAGQ